MTAEKDAVITDEMLSGLRARIGIPRHRIHFANEYATKDTIRKFAEGYADVNPLWTDEVYASKSRWGGIIAPPMFLDTMGIPETKEIPTEVRERGKGGGLAGVHGFNSGIECEWFRPIRLGDRLTALSVLADVTEKQSQFSGRTIFETEESIYKNQNHEIVGVTRILLIRAERHKAREKGKYSSVTRQYYTEEDLKKIEAAYDKEEIRGANPRYWEDVNIGDGLCPLVKGPLTVTDIIAWYRGSVSPYIRAHRLAYEHRKKHPHAWPKNSYGVPDVVERVHWDQEMAERTGNPAPYDLGAQRQTWLSQIVTNWMGDDGFLRSLKVQLSRFNYIGDTTWIRGRVSNRRVEDGEYLVECHIWAENQRSETTAMGSAVVLLPSREGGPVPIPAKGAEEYDRKWHDILQRQF